MSDVKRMTLITNVSFIQQQGTDVRLWAKAVLIEKGAPSLGAPVNMIRGFGVDGAEAIFTAWIKGDPYPFELRSASDPHLLMLANDQSPKPIFSGGVLQLASGEEFFIQVEDSERPFDVAEFAHISEVWGALPVKVADYWRAPYCPVLRFESVEWVRRIGAHR